MNLLPLLDELSSDEPTEREFAETRLRDMGISVIRPLFQIRRREKMRLLPDYDYFVLVTGMFLIPIFVSAVFIFLVSVAQRPDTSLSLLLSWLVSLWLLMWCYKRLVDRRMRRLEARKRLAQRRLTDLCALLDRIDDVRAVGALIDAMGGGQDLSFAPVPLLIRLLPQLKPEDAGLLSGRNRTLLNNMLQTHYAESHPDFVLAILKGMEQVGDSQTAERIRRLSETFATTPHLLRICVAARKSLIMLEARLEREGRQGVLLRPSRKPDEAALLLQPARAEPQPAPEQLVRVMENREGP